MCGGCDKNYVGEISRMFGVKKAEHRAEAEEASKRHFIRNIRKTLERQFNEYVITMITDHDSESNHTMNWGEATVIDKGQGCFRRGVKEAIHIRFRGKMFIIPYHSS